MVEGDEAEITTLLRNIDQCWAEEVLNASAGATTMNINSASGGLELGEFHVDEKLLSARDAVQSIERELLQGIRPAERHEDPDVLAEVCEFFQQYLTELDEKGRELTGDLASPAPADSFARLLATHGPGALAGHFALLLGKDVTPGDLQGLTSFFSLAAGSGPAVHHNVERWCNSDDNTVTHQPDAPRTTAFADLWSLNGRHPEELILLVSARLAREIEMVDPDVVISLSASLAWLLRHGWLADGKKGDKEKDELVLIRIKWSDIAEKK